MRANFPFSRIAAAVLILVPACANAAAAETMAAPPSVGASLIRMLGALCVVLALFFGGAWLFRNWARLNAGRTGSRKLQVLEGRSLGARQSVFVIGYEQQRFLVGSTAQGLVLLSHLPEGEPAVESSKTPAPLPFAEAFMQALGRK